MAQRLPELDGLRGIAILLVLGFHIRGWSEDLLPAPIRIPLALGWCGVDLFFALSGFLITGILLDMRENPDRWKVFYLRRAARILPLYYAALVLCFVVIPPPSGEQIWYWVHLSNWHTAFAPLGYPQLTHFWSLAIEEQFYAIWPLLVWHLSRRRLLHGALAVIVASVVLRNLPANQAINAVYDNYLYRLTPFRLDALLMGSIVALAYRNRQLAARWIRHAVPIGAASLAAFVGCALIDKAYPAVSAMSRVGYTAIGLASAAAVAHAAFTGGSQGLCAFFRLPTLRSFGKYSYFIYLAHGILAVVLYKIRNFLGGGMLVAIIAALCFVAIIYALAAASWRIFEKPILSMAPDAKEHAPMAAAAGSLGLTSRAF